jgi:hypothetical protein
MQTELAMLHAESGDNAQLQAALQIVAEQCRTCSSISRRLTAGEAAEKS